MIKLAAITLLSQKKSQKMNFFVVRERSYCASINQNYYDLVSSFIWLIWFSFIKLKILLTEYCLAFFGCFSLDWGILWTTYFFDPNWCTCRQCPVALEQKWLRPKVKLREGTRKRLEEGTCCHFESWLHVLRKYDLGFYWNGIWFLTWGVTLITG